MEEQIEKLCRISQPGKDREKWQICVARYSGTDGLKYCFKPAEPTFFLYPPGRKLRKKTIRDTTTESLLLICVLQEERDFHANWGREKERQWKIIQQGRREGEDEVVVIK